MGFAKDRMIEQMEEDRKNLENSLDGIECYGERFECPNEFCDSKVLSKECFARHCFDWCLVHEHPSVEEKHGRTSVKVAYTKKDAEGHIVTTKSVKQRRVCGHQDVKDFPGDCNIVTSPFLDNNDLREFENERQMQDLLARESP